jgi:hypothetical protein
MLEGGRAVSQVQTPELTIRQSSETPVEVRLSRVFYEAEGGRPSYLIMKFPKYFVLLMVSV